MRHRKSARKFGRTSSHRHAMFRNMVVSLFQHERIETTDTKAKELRRIAEKLITQGKRNTLHSRRMAAKWVRDSAVLQKLFADISPRYTERPGGYTRIIKVKNRLGDNAPISIIELMPAGTPNFKNRKKVVEAEAAPVATKETFNEEAVEAEAAAVEAAEEAPVEKVTEEAPAEESPAEEAPAAEAAEETSDDD
jgi:large subunit ribosomal protein L17